MKKAFKTIYVLLMCILFSSCEDILEENISDDTIRAISPKDNELIEGNSVNFTWSGLDGADDYRIQVLKGDTEEIIIDSLLSDNFLVLPMTSGSYDWRVRGENFAYQTGYSFPESFIVESTNDLSTQNVFLNSPTDNLYSKNNNVSLNWSALSAATSYTLQVKKAIGGNTSVVLLESDIVTTNYPLDNSVLDEDAEYTWGVRAVNDISQTPEATRKILLDTTLPNQPLLSSPNDDATVSLTVNFIWSLGQDTGEIQSPVESVLEISSDENFVTVIASYTTGNSSQQHIFEVVGQYYWRVSAMDTAGNVSPISATRILTVE